ncbi:MAG: 1-acyl-sn-glycerol-3-phosphate acyltransferase [Treponema sp.]|jgi:1-acyl-sn-glycerol-3-phosphate acyltransferase|nr:1-acyl-sn-glycerol-3-phosphate acyltransferase [Treponema sp.]
MQPIKNHVLYVWRVFVKWFSFFIFGLGAVSLGLVILPAMRLFLREQTRFQKYGRIVLSCSFRVLSSVMAVLGVIVIKTDDRAAFRHIEGKILAANHPSLLDVVILISLIPNADCIVNAALLHNIVSAVITRLYIPNSLDHETLLSRCAESLAQGNCLIIFPEGTRTRRSGPIKVMKGAARVSVLTGRPVLPVLIGGNDKWGLGKKDPWWAYNHTERYRYELRVLPEIAPQRYAGLPVPAAVKRLNDDIKKTLFAPMGRELL